MYVFNYIWIIGHPTSRGLSKRTFYALASAARRPRAGDVLAFHEEIQCVFRASRKHQAYVHVPVWRTLENLPIYVAVSGVPHRHSIHPFREITFVHVCVYLLVHPASVRGCLDDTKFRDQGNYTNNDRRASLFQRYKNCCSTNVIV